MGSTTKSTPAIVNEYERALQRARKTGLRIAGQGRFKQDGTPFVAVSSSREPNRYYLVIVGRHSLFCECAAGVRGKLCTHRALVHARLLHAWEKERDRVEAQLEADLRASLLELQACHRILDATLRRPMPTMAARGEAPAITQREAAALLQSPRPPRSPSMARGLASPDVAYLDERGVASDARREPIRGFSDTRPFSLFK